MRPPSAPRRPSAPSGTGPAKNSAKKSAKNTAKKPATKPAKRTKAAPQQLVKPAGRGRPARSSTPSRGVAASAATARVSTSLRARLAERNQAGRRLMWKKVAAISGGVLAVIALGWLVLVSPVLALDSESIQVTGASEHVPTEAVDEVLTQHVGTPLLRVDTGSIAEEIQGLDSIAEVTVTRSWPDGLMVTLASRAPVAATEHEGQWVLIDAEGVQVATLDQAPEELPEIDVPLDEAGRTSAAVEAVLTVLGDLPEGLLEDVAEAGATGTAQVTLELADGAAVRWGSAEENEYKAAVLAVLMEHGSASYYDVSVPSSPATRP